LSKLDTLLDTLLEAMVDEINKDYKKNKTTKENFKPHLEVTKLKENYGLIGEETDIIDINGIALCVGDIVGIMDCENNAHMGLSWVVKDGEEGYKILGAYDEKFENGVSKVNDICIYQAKSYKGLKHNEQIKLFPIKAKLVFEE
jgi:hypothetical protein